MISQSNHSVLRRLATASLYLATLAAAFPPSAVLGQTVHLVVAADTTEASGLGGDVIADKAGIRQLFESHIPSGQLRVKTIETANLTPDGILNTVGELQVEHAATPWCSTTPGTGPSTTKSDISSACPATRNCCAAVWSRRSSRRSLARR